MRFITSEQMRVADKKAIAKADSSGILLMSRAGTALARVVETVAALRQVKRVVLIAGHGNNGGDACIAARCLAEDGLHVQVIMTCVPATLKGEAREAWDEMRTAGVPYVVLASAESWRDDLPVLSGTVMRHGVIVDGVLGIGCKGAPTGAAEQAILWINRMRPHALVVSADIPSGMNGDTGVAAGVVVHADVTVTFGRPKRCFLNQEQAFLVGQLMVADIGIPAEIADNGVADTPCQLITAMELSEHYGQRLWSAHKGSFGHLCILGGAPGYAHAPVLAALGAIQSGVGRLTLVVPPASAPAAAMHVPEVMTHVLGATMQAELTLDALRLWGRDLNAFDVMVAGPGLTTSEHARALIYHLLEHASGRLVLDADALNILADLDSAKVLRPAGQQRILTPHPGEAARLLKSTVAEVQADRLTAVQRLAEMYQAVVVLKGAGSLVCEPGGTPWINMTGNPGMASGGMGDVLAGMIGALWAQGLSPQQAASTAVWTHAMAGDFAAFADGQTTLKATSLTYYLGRVFRLLERGDN